MQKIKQDIALGKNIRSLRLAKRIGQTELAKKLQLVGCDLTREALVKIERGKQNIKASQLVAIKKVLSVTYDDIFQGVCD